MYFLIACNDEPPRSFNDLMALHTISEVGGRFGADRGDFFSADFFATFFTAGDVAAASGAAVVGADTSDMIHDMRCARYGSCGSTEANLPCAQRSHSKHVLCIEPTDAAARACDSIQNLTTYQSFCFCRLFDHDATNLAKKWLAS